MIDYHERMLLKDPGHTQFICFFSDDQYVYIMLYNDIINYITNQEDEILCVNSNILLTMRDRLTTHIPTTKDMIIMFWLNGKQEIIQPITSLSL